MKHLLQDFYLFVMFFYFSIEIENFLRHWLYSISLSAVLTSCGQMYLYTWNISQWNTAGVHTFHWDTFEVPEKKMESCSQQRKHEENRN